jgi:hypothetical protein
MQHLNIKEQIGIWVSLRVGNLIREPSLISLSAMMLDARTMTILTKRSPFSSNIISRETRISSPRLRIGESEIKLKEINREKSS